MSEQALRIEYPVGLDTSKICYWKDEVGWWVYLPKAGAGVLSSHKVEEHEDGTITVTPSILLAPRHGYLTRGLWKETT
jgi:hypothetical protein